MSTILVTGANRGIGLEYVRQFLANGDTTIACCRDPAAAHELQQLRTQYGAKSLRLAALDVGFGESVERLGVELAGQPLDTLINNAGIYGSAAWPAGARLQSLDGMDYALWEQILRVNLLGAFHVTATLMPNVLAGTGKRVLMISSDLGSIANTTGSSHAYRSSKAALNMVTRSLAAEFKARGITIVALAPGWTQTDLGGPGAQWTAQDSVARQRQVIAALSIADSGRFINLTGEDLPW